MALDSDTTATDVAADADANTTVEAEPTSWFDGLARPQQILVEELLGRSVPRPPVDDQLAGELRTELESGLAAVTDVLPPGQDLFISKSGLAALECDGRYLDQLDSPFTYSVAIARGEVTHRALELALVDGWRTPPDRYVQLAMDDCTAQTSSLGIFLRDEITEVERIDLYGHVQGWLAEFADAWPPLPTTAGIRIEQRIRVEAAGGRVKLVGTPDMQLGTTHPTESRRLLIDFKTGMRRPVQDTLELRYYGLLATLKYRQPPWRVAAYYVAEGAWAVDDLTADSLRATVKRVTSLARRMAVLKFDRPPDSELTLVGGRWCRWCSRAATCPEAPEEALAP